MKKIIKIIIISIIIISILFLINFLRNYFVLKKIYDLGNNFEPNNNFRLQKTTDTEFGKTIINYYVKDNNYLYIEENYTTSKGNKNKEIISGNMNNDKYTIYSEDGNGNLTKDEKTSSNKTNEFLESFIYCNSYSFNELLKHNLFKLIKENDNCFIININNQNEYIDKSNGLLSKLNSNVNNANVNIIFEENVVEDKNIDINQYLTID